MTYVSDTARKAAVYAKSEIPSYWNTFYLYGARGLLLIAAAGVGAYALKRLREREKSTLANGQASRSLF